MSTTNTKNTDASLIAHTIVQQLGGPRIFAMAFKQAVHGERDVTFHVARGLKTANKCTHITIALEADDTYTVTFIKVARRGMDVTEIDVVGMVLASELRPLIEQTTGLYLTLGTMGADLHARTVRA